MNDSSLPGNKVLFIGHEASLSGAPLVMLYLLKWIKANTKLQFEILLLNDGPLKLEFEQLAPTFILPVFVKQHSYLNRIRNKLFAGTATAYEKAASMLSKRGYAMVYGNTIVCVPLLTIFKEKYGLRTICNVHEQSYVLNYFFTDGYLEKNLAKIDRIIAVSDAVKQNLVNKYKLADGKVSLHYEFIDAEIAPPANDSTLLRSLDIADDELIIGAGGDPSWRKGTDLLIPLTLRLAQQYPDLKFRIVWLGGNPESDYLKQLFIDAEKCGIKSHLLFIPHQAKPLGYINLFDVFLLLSREDPFPLIALEAAFLKKPVIAFENAGGIPELLIRGAGFTVPYLDIEKLSEVIYELACDPVLIEKTGEKGNKLILADYNTNAVAPAIYQEIMVLLNRNERAVRE